MTALEVVTKYLEAMRAGDYETGFSFYADDIEGRFPGRSRFAREVRGREELTGLLREIVDSVDDTEIELIDTLAGESNVALMLDERFVRGGETLVSRQVNVYTITGEKITRIEIFVGDQHALDAFLG
jgi:ketosteroid isomerase-like protein